MRARRRGGEWSRWVPLHARATTAPTASGPCAGTDPAWTGAADLFQLRLRGRPRGAARPLRPRGADRASRAASAAAAPPRAPRRARPSGPPAIIPRSEWGADSVPPRAPPAYGAVQLAFVHHTVTANDYGPRSRPAIVLSIAHYHRDSNGWNDIGYNFLVDQYGQIFEGRAGGIDQAVIGAQAQGYNSVSTGIACLGTFARSRVRGRAGGARAPPRVEARAPWRPRAGPVTVVSAGGPSNRYPRGTPVTFERIAGHRDGDSTCCPGASLYAPLPDLRAAGDAVRHAGVAGHAARRGATGRRRAAGDRGRAALRRRLSARRRSRWASSSRRRARRGSRSRPSRAGPTAAGRPRGAARERPRPGGVRGRRDARAARVRRRARSPSCRGCRWC